MRELEIVPISTKHYHELAVMVGELLQEIMDTVGETVFTYDKAETEDRAKALIEQGKYWVFLAHVQDLESAVGFVSLYESYALYSEGAYGTIPELYVRPAWRSTMIGTELIKTAIEYGKEKEWRRLEVTTPPLPSFERTLNFYQSIGFTISGGRKLKIDI